MTHYCTKCLSECNVITDTWAESFEQHGNCFSIDYSDCVSDCCNSEVTSVLPRFDAMLGWGGKTVTQQLDSIFSPALHALLHALVTINLLCEDKQETTGQEQSENIIKTKV